MTEKELINAISQLEYAASLEINWPTKRRMIKLINVYIGRLLKMNGVEHDNDPA
jgi:hypothetical protein